MKASFVPMALALALAVPAFGQAPGSRVSKIFGNRGGASTSAAAQANTAAPVDNSVRKAAAPDPKVVPEGTALPEPTKPDDIKPPTIDLPDGPVDAYKLTNDAGPFMVLAHTFRGPEATKYALALVLELRNEYHLPTWIFLAKTQPNHSPIFNIPPVAPPYVKTAETVMPEKVRMYDEAAVLVGNCKTLEESLKLLHQVKKIHPKCLDGLPNMWEFRRGKGLSRATRTTNPLVPAQRLYPNRVDPLIKQMNSGPMSLFNCPSRYTLQVAEFIGRSSLDANDKNFGSLTSLMSSPLRTAADDAQKLANALAKDPEVVRTGLRPYVYHDRTSSKVTLGAFDQPNDPRAAAARKMMLTDSELKTRLAKSGGVTSFIVPADKLLDLTALPPH